MDRGVEFGRVSLKKILVAWVSHEIVQIITPPKINMEPENEPLEEEIPIKTFTFRFHDLRGCNMMGNPIGLSK